MSETAARPVTRSRENTRLRLMDAAFEVFAEVGLDAASVEAVCERAGFSRGAFYSNFESKDELFLELVSHFAQRKLDAVTDRVRELEAQGLVPDSPAEVVRRILDAAPDQRLGTILMSEIRTQALRDERMAAAYLAWHRGMIDTVTQIVGELVRVYGFRLRVPAEELGRLVIAAWEDTATTSFIEGLDEDAMCALVNERTERLAMALVDGPADPGR